MTERINEPPWGRCLQGVVDARWVVVVVVVASQGGHFELIVLRPTASLVTSEAPRAATELSLGALKASRRVLSIPPGPRACFFYFFVCFCKNAHFAILKSRFFGTFGPGRPGVGGLPLRRVGATLKAGYP